MALKTIGVVWRHQAKRLEKQGAKTPQLDARLLLGHVLGTDQLQLVGNEKKELTDFQYREFFQLINRRANGEPVARILGVKEFYSLEFMLNEATLIPRPETELLVDLSLAHLRGLEANDADSKSSLLELGVGTGCVSISILANYPDVVATGIDISQDAICLTEKNAKVHNVDDRVVWKTGSWFSPLKGDEKFDLIVSNPPYIASAKISELEREVSDFDPLLALDGGDDGLDAYREIVGGALARLNPWGFLILEIGFDQAENVRKLLIQAGFEQICLHRDLNAHIRAIEARKTND